MLERRKTRRRKMVLPIKVSIAGTCQLAHTLDITYAGAKLGLRASLKPGEVFTLQRGSQKANFRVAWMRELTPTEIQVGVECVEPRDNFWGVDLSAEEREEKKNVSMLMTLLSES